MNDRIRKLADQIHSVNQGFRAEEQTYEDYDSSYEREYFRRLGEMAEGDEEIEYAYEIYCLERDGEGYYI